MIDNQLTDKKPEQAARDRAILVVRLAGFGGAAGALGLSWLSGVSPRPTSQASRPQL